MAGADDDSAAWAAQLAGLLAEQAAAALELFSLLGADSPAGDEAEWLKSAERIEAQWRQFLEEHSEAFVAAWPDVVRHVTSLLPLLAQGQPLFAMLAQLWPLLVGPAVLRRAIESGGTSMVEALEQFLTDLRRGQITPADPAEDLSGPDRTLP